MRPAENIEKLINTFRVEPRAGVSKRNLDDSLAAYKKATDSTCLRPTIWSKIIRNPLIKLGTAAAIIIAVLLIFNNRSVDITTPAFGLDDITAAMQKAKWMHCIITLEELSGNTNASPMSVGEKLECWESMNPNISVTKQSDGKIDFSESNMARISRYDPETNVITIENKNPSDSKEIHTSISDKFLNIFTVEIEKQFENIKYEESVFEGRLVTIISVDKDFTPEADIHYMGSFIIDSETYLPKKMSIQQTFVSQNVTGTTTWIFDYPESGPKDIYEAGAPRDAKVVIIEN